MQNGSGQNQLVKVPCSDLNSFACTKTEGKVPMKFPSCGIRILIIYGAIFLFKKICILAVSYRDFAGGHIIP